MVLIWSYTFYAKYVHQNVYQMKRKYLNQRQIVNLPEGAHCDGEGLYIIKRTSKAGKWVLRFNFAKRPKQMGLGPWPQVGLAEARERAGDAKRMLRDGRNPIEEKAKKRAEASALLRTFRSVTLEKFKVERHTLKGEGANGRWLSPLTHHVFPKLGDVPINRINQLMIRDALQPIWHTKGETALKALNRTRMVLKFAAAQGLAVDLNAVELAKELLGPQKKNTANIQAMPWQEVPAFYQSLDNHELTQLVLKLTILTGVRPSAARQCRLAQIDGEIWTIPGEVMKGRQGETDDFRVPLTAEAIRVIEAASRFERDGLLFASLSGKGTISDAMVSKYMRVTRGLPYKVHGFRSSLRTWAEFNTAASFEAKEMLLAHKERNQVARAYIRTDYFDMRKLIIQQWNDFITN